MLTDAQRKTLDRIAAPGSYLDGYSPTAAEALRAALAEIDRKPATGIRGILVEVGAIRRCNGALIQLDMEQARALSSHLYDEVLILADPAPEAKPCS